MIVDIDIGNTRAKWRLTAGAEVVQRGVIATDSQDWSALLAMHCYQPERVRVSNVAGKLVEQQVRAAITGAFELAHRWVS